MRWMIKNQMAPCLFVFGFTRASVHKLGIPAFNMFEVELDEFSLCFHRCTPLMCSQLALVHIGFAHLLGAIGSLGADAATPAL